MTTERRHRRHTTELKLRLVESYLNGEGSLKLIAKSQDITHTLLMMWVDKYRRGELTDEIDHVERAREAEAKIAALERKVGQLTMELAVQKNATSNRHRQRLCVDHLRSGGISVSEESRVMNLPRSTTTRRLALRTRSVGSNPTTHWVVPSNTSSTAGRRMATGA